MAWTAMFLVLGAVVLLSLVTVLPRRRVPRPLLGRPCGKARWASWITPTRLVVEHHGLRSELPLREVATVTPRSESVHVAPAGPVTVTHRFLTPWPWRAGARSADLVIPSAGAPGGSEGLAALVRKAAASATP